MCTACTSGRGCGVPRWFTRVGRECGWPRLSFFLAILLLFKKNAYLHACPALRHADVSDPEQR